MHLLFPGVAVSLVSQNEQIELTQWLIKNNLQHQHIHLTKAKVALRPFF